MEDRLVYERILRKGNNVRNVEEHLLDVIKSQEKLHTHVQLKN